MRAFALMSPRYFDIYEALFTSAFACFVFCWRLFFCYFMLLMATLALFCRCFIYYITCHRRHAHVTAIAARLLPPRLRHLAARSCPPPFATFAILPSVTASDV